MFSRFNRRLNSEEFSNLFGKCGLLDSMLKVQDQKGRTALDVAALNNNISAMRFLLQHNIAGLGRIGLYLNVNLRINEVGLLHFAVANRFEFLVKELLRQGSDTEDRDSKGRTPIHHASFQQLEQLVKFGCDVNATDIQGQTALHYACEGRCEPSVRVLLEAGALTNIQDQFGKTALHIACDIYGLRQWKDDEDWEDDQDWEEELLRLDPMDWEDEGADEEEEQNDHSDENQQPDPIVAMLMKHGADPFVLDKKFSCPFERVNNDEILELLVSSPCRPPETFPKSTKKLQMLVDAGLDPNSVDSRGRTMLHACCEIFVDRLTEEEDEIPQEISKIIQLIQQMSARGLAPNIVDNTGSSALHRAVLRVDRGHFDSSIQTIQTLLDIGANINLPDRMGRTALHLASNFGRDDLVKWLLQHGADINAVDNQANTPLHHANGECIKSLLSAGANATLRNKKAETTLHCFFERISIDTEGILGFAVEIKNMMAMGAFEYEQFIMKTLQLLIKNGADPLAEDDQRQTILHRAAGAMCGVKTISHLRQIGCDVDCVDSSGNTPLHLFLKRFAEFSCEFEEERAQALEDLADYGDLGHEDVDTILDAVFEYKHKSITTLLPSNFPVERGNSEGEQLIAYAQELDGLEGTDTLAFLEKNIFKPSTEHALATT